MIEPKHYKAIDVFTSLSCLWLLRSNHIISNRSFSHNFNAEGIKKIDPLRLFPASLPAWGTEGMLQICSSHTLMSMETFTHTLNASPNHQERISANLSEQSTTHLNTYAVACSFNQLTTCSLKHINPSLGTPRSWRL